MTEPAPKKALLFIFITLLVDVMGLGIIIPVMPDLIANMAHVDNARAVVIAGYMMFVYSIMQFFFSPVIGGLSDRFGRRPVLLLSLLGFGIDYFLLGFAGSLWILFVGRTIAGITGASFTTATAYIADISKPEDRAKNFGMVGAAFGLGFILGPAIGGLLGHAGLRVPFFAAGILSLINVAFGYFVLPESLSLANRRKFEWKRANPFGALVHLKRYPMLIGLALAFMLVNLAGQSLPATWAFYGKQRFDWDTDMIGYSLAFVGLMIAIVQGGLNRVIVPKLGERNSVLLGLFLYSIGLSVCASATASWMLFAGCVPLALGGLAGPTMQGMMSGQVPANEQGELQGTLTSLISIDAIIGPLLFPQLFFLFTKADAPAHIPGASFYCAALLSLISLFVCINAFRKRRIAAEKQMMGM
jgi:MFS transporter, DHA1 family, tetracycline resistance protein